MLAGMARQFHGTPIMSYFLSASLLALMSQSIFTRFKSQMFNCKIVPPAYEWTPQKEERKVHPLLFCFTPLFSNWMLKHSFKNKSFIMSQRAPTPSWHFHHASNSMPSQVVLVAVLLLPPLQTWKMWPRLLTVGWEMKGEFQFLP